MSLDSRKLLNGCSNGSKSASREIREASRHRAPDSPSRASARRHERPDRRRRCSRGLGRRACGPRVLLRERGGCSQELSCVGGGDGKTSGGSRSCCRWRSRGGGEFLTMTVTQRFISHAAIVEKFLARPIAVMSTDRRIQPPFCGAYLGARQITT